MDMADIDEVFEFANELIKKTATETLKAVRKPVSLNAQRQIIHNVLTEYFTLGQIWERLTDKEREVHMKGMRPEEIVQLRNEGWRMNNEGQWEKNG